MSEKRQHAPTPWAVDPDIRPGMEWNIHITLASDPNHRVCFMTSGPEGKLNAAFIVDAANSHQVLLDEIASLRIELDGSATQAANYRARIEDLEPTLAKAWADNTSLRASLEQAVEHGAKGWAQLEATRGQVEYLEKGRQVMFERMETAEARLVQAKALIKFIEDETNRYAEMYGRNSDGRNTFTILRDVIAARYTALTDEKGES